MKITTFITALILISVVATTFTLATVDLADKYDVTYDNETLEVFEDNDDLLALSADLENKTNSLETESGIFDVVGNYVGAAIDTLKLSMKSFGTFEKMTGKATEKVGLPGYFLPALLSIMLVLIIIGVIASAMVKRDL